MASATTPQIPVRKSPQDLEAYQAIGPEFNLILAELLHMVQMNDADDHLGSEIDEQFMELCHIRFRDAKPYFPFRTQRNYLDQPFGSATCVCRNHHIAHGDPGCGVACPGDILTVDCGVSVATLPGRRLHLDSAFTATVDSKTIPDWVKAPHKALQMIVEEQPRDTKQIAEIIQQVASDHGLRQVVSLTGHGIGYALHEAPVIHNAVADFKPVDLFEGLCFCAEPIYVKPGKGSSGSWVAQTCLEDDGWTVSTVSREPASHFETTFGVINGQIVDLVGVTKWKL
jgi:methionine aminopeptidase